MTTGGATGCRRRRPPRIHEAQADQAEQLRMFAVVFCCLVMFLALASALVNGRRWLLHRTIVRMARTSLVPQTSWEPAPVPAGVIPELVIDNARRMRLRRPRKVDSQHNIAGQPPLAIGLLAHLRQSAPGSDVPGRRLARARVRLHAARRELRHAPRAPRPEADPTFGSVRQLAPLSCDNDFSTRRQRQNAAADASSATLRRRQYACVTGTARIHPSRSFATGRSGARRWTSSFCTSTQSAWTSPASRPRTRGRPMSCSGSWTGSRSSASCS